MWARCGALPCAADCSEEIQRPCVSIIPEKTFTRWTGTMLGEFQLCVAARTRQNTVPCSWNQYRALPVQCPHSCANAVSFLAFICIRPRKCVCMPGFLRYLRRCVESGEAWAREVSAHWDAQYTIPLCWTCGSLVVLPGTVSGRQGRLTLQCRILKQIFNKNKYKKACNTELFKTLQFNKNALRSLNTFFFNEECCQICKGENVSVTFMRDTSCFGSHCRWGENTFLGLLP